jgi:ABC-type glycerol-3-phosphate transport system substrate-binding protein
VDPLARSLTRRQLLRYSAGGLAAAGLGPLLAACGGGSESSPSGGGAASTGASGGGGGGGGGNIKMWWWGDQEAVGVKAWVDDTITKFKADSGITVDPLLMDTSNVIPQFTNAAAAGKPPDVQFIFNGIYHMENVWLGYLAPLDGLVSADILSKSGETVLSHYQGKQYRVGFYIVGFGFLYNKDLFDKAGLNADSPPTTWDAFLDACDKLKTSGVIPIGGGIKDGFWGEWYFVNSLTQNLDSPKEALDLFIGDLDWRDPKYHEHWVRLEELVKSGFINDDINSLELYPGIQLTLNGKAGMSIDTTADLPNAEKTLGENVGYYVFPVYGSGSMAGKPITDTQGFGIPTKAKDQESAARFLEFMHSQERVNAMWSLSKALPADEKFDSSLIDDAFLKTVYETWWTGDHNVYVADLMPTLFWTDAMFVASQKILSGDMTGEEAGDLAAQVTEKWKKQNPDLVENYKTWGADLNV